MPQLALSTLLSNVRMHIIRLRSCSGVRQTGNRTAKSFLERQSEQENKIKQKISVVPGNTLMLLT
jgi:hypothetical protein